MGELHEAADGAALGVTVGDALGAMDGLADRASLPA